MSEILLLLLRAHFLLDMTSNLEVLHGLRDIYALLLFWKVRATVGDLPFQSWCRFGGIKVVCLRGGLSHQGGLLSHG